MDNQFTRKLQRTGGVSISITLPKSWIEITGLDVGKVVQLSINENRDLVIHAPNKNQNEPLINSKDLNINILDNDFLIRKIIAAYLAGNNVLNLKSNKNYTREEVRKIEQILSRFIGLEVIESSAKEISIQDLSSSRSIHLMRFIKKMNRTIQDMLSNVIEGFENSEVTLFESCILEEPNVDKVYFMLSRQLRQYLNNIPSDSEIKYSNVIDFERIIKRLEGLADHCYKISQIAIHDLKNGAKLDIENEVILVAKLLHSKFGDMMRAFFTKNIDDANTLINEILEIKNRVWKQIVNFNMQDSSLTAFNLLRLLERIINYIADIGESTINIYS